MSTVTHEEPALKASLVHRNLGVASLVEEAVRRGEATLSSGGALVALTGEHTGRSPNDKYLVEEPESASRIWWGKVNRPIAPASFDSLLSRVRGYLRGRDVFVQDLYAGADPEYRLPIRVITERAWHSLFARHLFIRPEPGEELPPPEFTVIDAPGCSADPKRDGTRGPAFIVLSLARRIVLIGG